MEKKLLNKEIEILLNDYHQPIKWKDVKFFEFKDEDILSIGYVEPWENGSDNSGGDYYQAIVIRKVLETDEQFEKRCKMHEDYKKIVLKQRYETFLTLKKEFEP